MDFAALVNAGHSWNHNCGFGDVAYLGLQGRLLVGCFIYSPLSHSLLSGPCLILPGGEWQISDILLCWEPHQSLVKIFADSL